MIIVLDEKDILDMLDRAAARGELPLPEGYKVEHIHFDYNEDTKGVECLFHIEKELLKAE